MTKQPEIGRPTKQNHSTNREIAIKSRARKRPARKRRRPRNAEQAARTSPINATRARGGTGSPRGPCRPPRPLARIEKRPPRARRPALPQPGAAVLSAKAGLTAGFGMGPGDPRLCGRARGGRSPAAHGYEPARVPFRGDPGGRAAKEATRVSTPRKIPYEDAKSSGYQQRSAERVAPLAPAPCRPGVLPGPLPESGLISETASRLDAFSGYPCRA